eukprot:3178-Heterococcus_DN1.PRE.4
MLSDSGAAADNCTASASSLLSVCVHSVTAAAVTAAAVKCERPIVTALAPQQCRVGELHAMYAEPWQEPSAAAAAAVLLLLVAECTLLSGCWHHEAQHYARTNAGSALPVACVVREVVLVVAAPAPGAV